MDLLDVIRLVSIGLIIVLVWWMLRLVKRTQTSVRDIVSRTRSINEDMKVTIESMRSDASAARQTRENMQTKVSDLISDVKNGIESVSGSYDDLDKKIVRLGARWGLHSENAFRAGMEAILTEAGFSVEKYRKLDTESVVFAHPSEVEIDVVAKNGKTILIEIKSRIDRNDVLIFDTIAKFYETEESRSVDRKIMISPYIEDRAKIVADTLGIELCTDATDITGGGNAS